MKRREFNQTLFGVLGGLAVRDLSHPGQGSPLLVNGRRLNRHLAELAELGPDDGVTRVAYSDADLQARAYVMDLMRVAGLEVGVDAGGNIVGRRAGRDSHRPPIMVGSHIDSVPAGGNYDGQVGSLGAIEVTQTLAERGVVTRHPLEVVIFQNEEGGKTGSRLISGEVLAAELDIITHSGKTIGAGIEILGGDVTQLGAIQRHPGDIAAYLELHIEQGGILESEGIDIGVVQGIVGIKRWMVTVEGFANHAGTTPMEGRRDALLAAARFVDAVNRVVTGISGRQVGTVGRLEPFPGAPNVIPGRVILTLELRDLDMAKIDELYGLIETEAQVIGQQSGTTFELEQFYVSRAAVTDDRLQQFVEDSARELDLTTLRMPSGAGHDAQSIALLAPIGMIFIASVQGISHSPLEFSRPGDITSGANVLLHALLKTDKLDP